MADYWFGPVRLFFRMEKIVFQPTMHEDTLEVLGQGYFHNFRLAAFPTVHKLTTTLTVCELWFYTPAPDCNPNPPTSLEILVFRAESIPRGMSTEFISPRSTEDCGRLQGTPSTF